MAGKEKILIIRSDRIGDVVLTLPMAEVLKKRSNAGKHFEKSELKTTRGMGEHEILNNSNEAKTQIKDAEPEVWFMGRGYTESIIKACPFIDGFINREEFESKGLTEAVSQLKKHSFNRVFVVSPDFKIALITRLAGIEKRTGTGYRWYSFLFNDRIFEHRKTGEKSELEYNLGMIPWNKDYQYSPEILGLAPEYDGIKVDSRKIVTIVHPGSGGSSVDLPALRFREIVKGLDEDERFEVYITGAANEVALCNEVKGESKAKVVAGELTLPELTGFIKKCDLFISNSTGPIHIAAAAECFTVGFYPKMPACSATRWGPRTKRRLIFEPGEECGCTSLKQCARLNCMNNIDSSDVIQSIKEKINEIKTGK